MKASHAILLLAIPLLTVAATVLATWSRRVRDAWLFLMLTTAVFAERLDVNYFSEAWYRGTSRGLQISLPDILAVALIGGTVLSRRAADELPRWFWPGGLGLMLAYLAYACVSVIVSTPRMFGAFELMNIAGGILIFLAAAAHVRTRREWTVVIVALAFAVGFESLWAIKQRLITHLERGSGTLDHANSLSMYLCLTTPVLIAAAFGGWGPWLRRFCGISAGLSAVAILFTLSRAGIPIFAAFALATFLACASTRLSVRMVLVRIGIAAGAVALLAALWQPIAARYGEATMQEEFLDANVDGRGVYLRLAGAIAQEHFFGIGLNNWSYYVSSSYGPRLGYHFETYQEIVSAYGTADVPRIFGDAYLAAPAHNLAALTLGELGVPGLVLFTALWIRWFSLGMPFLFGHRGDPMRTIGVGIFFGLCGILCQSMTEWVFRQTPIFLTFNILIGTLASLAYARKARRAAAIVPEAPAAIPGISPAPQGV